MSTCEWCGLEILYDAVGDSLGMSKWFHSDCLQYGRNLNTEAMGWVPSRKIPETNKEYDPNWWELM